MCDRVHPRVQRRGEISRAVQCSSKNRRASPSPLRYFLPIHRSRLTRKLRWGSPPRRAQLSSFSRSLAASRSVVPCQRTPTRGPRFQWGPWGFENLDSHGVPATVARPRDFVNRLDHRPVRAQRGGRIRSAIVSPCKCRNAHSLASLRQ